MRNQIFAAIAVSLLIGAGALVANASTVIRGQVTVDRDGSTQSGTLQIILDDPDATAPDAAATPDAGFAPDARADAAAPDAPAPDAFADAAAPDAPAPDARADASAPDASAPPPDGGFTTGCGKVVPGLGPTGYQAQRTIVVGGQPRTYYLSLLPNYNKDKPQAIVFGWHGSSWLGASFRPSIPVESYAQSQGADAIFVYPDGLGNPTGWGGASDLPFYDALRASLEAEFCLDTSRVYSYGRSFGAFMANTLACARGNGIRASAILSGWGPTTPCNKESTWIWHGTQDPTVGVSSGRASRDTWIMVDGANPAGAPYSPPSYCQRFAGPFDVVYCEDPNGVHWHPDGAETFIWNWFRAHGAQGGAPPPPPADAGVSLDAAPRPDAAAPDATPAPDAAPPPADAGFPPDAAAPADSGVVAAAHNLGTNLDTIVYWSTVPVFGNALKQSSRWFTGSGPATADNPPLVQDANGNIMSLAAGQIAKALLFSGGGHPSGDYQLLWNGVATWAVTQGASIVSTAPGRVVIRVAAGSTAQMELDLTSVGSPPPTNVRLMLPGLADGTEFNPAYLASLTAAGYTTLRFMNWGRASDDTINNASQVPTFTWAGRSQVNDIRYSSTLGVPIEVMADMMNATGTDAWFSVHHTADDTYVQNMAAVVCGRLAPGHKVYVEHSNEVWNGIFPQAAYVTSHGAGFDPDPFLAGMLYHAQRSAQIHALWVSACGANRVVRVLAGQAANSWLSNYMLNYALSKGLHFDALATAPYIGGNIRASEATSVDAVISLLSTRELATSRSWMQATQAVAVQYGMYQIAYEGGQHLTSFGASASADAVFQAAQTDPRLGAIYDSYLAAWATDSGSNGAHVFMHFLDIGSWSSAGGFWGARQFLSQSCASSPKCSALARYNGH